MTTKIVNIPETVGDLISLKFHKDIIVDGDSGISWAEVANPETADVDFLEEAADLAGVLGLAEFLEAVLADPMSIPEANSRRLAASRAFTHFLLHGVLLLKVTRP